MRKKKIKKEDNQTNLDFTIKSFEKYTLKSMESLSLMVHAFKDGLIDLDIYNKTLNIIDNNNFNVIIDNINKTK